MSMIAAYRSIGANVIAAIVRDPGVVRLVLDAGREPPGDTWPELLSLGIERHQVGEPTSIEKAWGGIRFLVITAAPGSQALIDLALFGRRSTGCDLAYGPANYLDETEVEESAAFLTGINHEALARFFDPAKMEAASVYPKHWDSDRLEWLLTELSRLSSCYSRAAESAHGMLACMR